MKQLIEIIKFLKEKQNQFEIIPFQPLHHQIVVFQHMLRHNLRQFRFVTSHQHLLNQTLPERHFALQAVHNPL